MPSQVNAFSAFTQPHLTPHGVLISVEQEPADSESSMRIRRKRTHRSHIAKILVSDIAKLRYQGAYRQEPQRQTLTAHLHFKCKKLAECSNAKYSDVLSTKYP